MRKCFFCYEKDFAGRWCPAAYFDSAPSKSVNGSDTVRSDVSEVSSIQNGLGEPKYLWPDGEARFALLQKDFPPPSM